MALWTVHGDGRNIADGEVVGPLERLSWPRTIGIGAQHVVSMFGATFVAPVMMGLDPQLAILFSGICTLLFLAVVRGRIPSYLGSSVSFIGVAGAIRAQGGDSADVTGAMLVAGALLAVVGVVVHVVGGRVVTAVLPPMVTGAVVMLIGFNLAGVVSSTYWPQDQWVALTVMVVLIALTIAVRGFVSRIAIFVTLVLGYALSWVLDVTSGPITSLDPAAGAITEHLRVDWTAVQQSAWFGLPPISDEAAGVVGVQAPTFQLAFVLLVIPGVVALNAENAGHVKAVAEMTGEDLDRSMGQAFLGDGLGTAVSGFLGGPPTTTYAENIGVMAATRVYSTAAYWVAAIFAILLGFSPKVGALIAAIPGGVLGGITVVLYGMIGLLGAKIWVENRIDLGNPINLVPLAAGLIIALGNIEIRFSESFAIGGISLGTIVSIVGWHTARMVAPRILRRSLSESAREDATFPEEHHGRHALPEKRIEW